jgi:hypothetical protein
VGTTPQGEQITDYYLMMLEDFEFEVPCQAESATHRKAYPDAHPADWVVLFSCGHSMNWCNPRLTLYVQEQVYGNGMFCVQCDPKGERQDTITVISKLPISGT